MLVCNKPPGTLATSCASPRYTRVVSPLACMISAIRMNNGMAVRIKLFMLPQLTRPSALNPFSPSCRYRYTSEGTVIANGTDMPSTSSTRNTPNTKTIAISGLMFASRPPLTAV